jgi:hypothetical protein
MLYQVHYCDKDGNRQIANDPHQLQYDYHTANRIAEDLVTAHGYRVIPRIDPQELKPLELTIVKR